MDKSGILLSESHSPLLRLSLSHSGLYSGIHFRIRHAEWDMFRLGPADEQGLQLSREILQESEQIFIAQLWVFSPNFLNQLPTIGQPVIPDIADNSRGVLGMALGIGVIEQILDRAPDSALILVIDFWQMLKQRPIVSGTAEIYGRTTQLS
jgi:hypothetical protein